MKKIWKIVKLLLVMQQKMFYGEREADAGVEQCVDLKVEEDLVLLDVLKEDPEEEGDLVLPEDLKLIH